MGLISHLKCCFKRIYEKNLRNFPLQGLPFAYCRLNTCWSALIFRKLPCFEKFLVTRLKDMVNFKIYNIKCRLTNNSIHILPNISRCKGNQALKFGQVIEYNNRSICLQKSCWKWSRETSSRPSFLKKLYMR